MSPSPSALDDDSVGIRVLAKLPEGGGLPSIAAALLDDPRPVFCLVEFRAAREVTDLEVGSHSITVRFVQIEPLAGDEADEVRRRLDVLREQRTGQVKLPGIDGAEVPAVDDAENREPVVPTGAPLDEASVPPFTEPTPIGSSRRTRKA